MLTRGCTECYCEEYIDSGKDPKFVLEKDRMHTTWEVICKQCGNEYGLRFIQGDIIGVESVEL